MSKVKSPQDKKKLSLVRDRRNTYGENAKSSRKNIPKSKQISQQAMRRTAKSPLRKIATISHEEDLLVDAELELRSAIIGKYRSGFRKAPDSPLGAVLERKRARTRS